MQAKPSSQRVKCENMKFHFCLTFLICFLKKTVLCHSCVSICFISHSGSFGVYWILIFGGWALDTLGGA